MQLPPWYVAAGTVTEEGGKRKEFAMKRPRWLDWFLPPRKICGYVDTVVNRLDVPIPNYDSSFWFKATYSPEVIGEEIRRRFVEPHGTFCIRLDHNNDPNMYVLVPDGFKENLRIGDFVECTITPDNQTKWCEGTVKELLVINGRSVKDHGLPKNSDRLNWLKLPDHMRLEVGPSYLNPNPEIGKQARFLKLVHLLPGTGDRVILVAGPATGKSTFVRKLMTETLEDVHIVYIGAERPEDLIMFLKTVGAHVEVFSSPETTPAIRKLHIVELGLHRAMRLAEMGTPEKPVRVLIVMDSLTKAVAKPVNSLPPPIAGVGIQQGGVSPILADVVTFVLGLGGNYGFASISEFVVVLNEGDSAGASLTMIAQGVSTGHIYLNETMPYWPKINFSPIKERNNTVPASRVRWMDQHVGAAIAAAANKLTRTFSVEHIERRLIQEATMRGERIITQAIHAEAEDEAEKRVMQLIELLNRDLTDKEILAQMGITLEEEASPVQQMTEADFAPPPLPADKRKLVVPTAPPARQLVVPTAPPVELEGGLTAPLPAS